MTNLELRLSFVVQAIDAGRFQTPEKAVQAILDVMGSHTLEHRDQLNRWVNQLPSVSSRDV